MKKTIGQIAYEAWYVGIDPEWNEIGARKKQDWEEAANAVLEKAAKAIDMADRNDRDEAAIVRALKTEVAA